MDNYKEFYLQQLTESSDWEQVAISTEYESLIGAGILRNVESGKDFRVIDDAGHEIWQTNSVLPKENAPKTDR